MNHPVPTKQQLAWQDLEFGLFVHFGMNTFTGREWGDGSEEPAWFNPTGLDCRQWAQVAKEAGMKYAILTAKHHDGFCLWPTATTRHSVKSSPWRGGKGDVVREFVDACREVGILPGLYCSPWDRNAPCYSDPKEYSAFYTRQLEELCTQYGPLVEIWLDGAGSEGYVYDWERIIGTVRRFQPDALIFQMGDPDIRWGGNELGYGDPDLWTVIDDTRASVHWENPRRPLAPSGVYLPAELDTTINHAGWFWHPGTADQIKSLDELIGVYYRSVGHGANLLLNLAPNREGRLEDAEVERLLELGREIRRRFGNPVGSAGPGGGELEIVLDRPALVARFEAMEDLSMGESVAEWVVEAQVGQDGLGRPAWHRLASGYALGHKRLGDFPPIRSARFRLRVTAARGEPRLRSFKVFAP